MSLAARASVAAPTLPPGAKTQFIRSNQVCCYLAFLLVSWIIGTISLLVANRHRDRDLVLLVITFFATQCVGAICAGAVSDLKGRRPAFLLACLALLCGLSGVLISCYPLFVTQPSSGSLPAVTRLLSHQSPTPPPFDQLQPSSPTLNPHLSSLAVPSGWTFWLLFISLALTGKAVGAFYPVIGILLVESVEPKSRVINVARMFCMQGLAYFLVRCGAAVIFSYNPSAGGLGVIVPLLVVALFVCVTLTVIAYCCMAETSVFLISYGLSRNPPPVVSSDNSLNAALLPRQNHEQPHALSCKKYARIVKRFFRPWDIVGTALPWLFFDCLFYGDYVFHYLLIDRVKGFDLDSQENGIAIVVAFVSLLGYLLGAKLVTRVNPKLLQILGFIVLSFVFFGLALSLYSISRGVAEANSISEYMGASLMYDCYFRFFNFIPNLTTFLIPLDAFPSKPRGFFVGLAAFASRLGCLSGLLLNWLVVEPFLSRASMLLCVSALSVAGAAVTRAATPHGLPPEEDLLKLDLIHLTRIQPNQALTRRSTRDERRLRLQLSPLANPSQSH